MLKMAVAEHLKMRHTFGGKLPVTAPVFTLCTAFVLAYKITDLVTQMAWNFWYTILLPGMLAIICCLGVNKDKKLNYCNILPVPFPAAKCLAGKIVYYAAGLFLANIIIFAGTLISVETTGAGIETTRGLMALMLLSVISLWEIPLFIILSMCFKMAGCIFSCMLLVCSSFIFASTDLWWIWLPSISPRLMCPVLGIMPNGILAPEGSKLLNSSVILPGIIISFVWFVVFSFLMVLCFNKRVVEE